MSLFKNNSIQERKKRFKMDTKIFRKFSYGLYMVSSKRGDKINGQIANTVFQISSDPATIGISVNRGNLTNEYIKESGVFAVSVLPESAPMSLIGHFGFQSGRDVDKFKTIPYKLGNTGAPLLLENSIGFVEAEVMAFVEAETHTVFIGKVVGAEVFTQEEPMTYAYYHFLKQGKVAQKAVGTTQEVPVHEDAKAAEENAGGKYVCSVCGYVYDPTVGDSGAGIVPGTAFEDLPEDWRCPICGVSKDKFRAE